MHFEGFMINSIFDGGQSLAMVNGAQRMQAGGGFGHETLRIGLLSPFEKLGEETDGDRRHVATDDQIPGSRGSLESRIDAAEGPATLDQVGRNRQAKAAVTFGRTDQRDETCGGAHSRGDLFHQRGAVDGQQGLVAAHSRTPAAGEHKALEKALFHEMMLARLGQLERNSLVQANKKVYICFLVAFAMLAASPMRAADQNTAGKVSVVRVDRRTGKLVRTVAGYDEPAAVKPAARPAHAPAQIGELVEQSARAHSIDPLLVDSVIQVESNYNPHAVSVKGAEGLMQLMPSTSRMLGVSNSFDPRQNIEAGVKYLKYLQDLYKDDRLALAAYNAGPAAVEKYKWVPPYPETQNYVNQVGKRYQDARKTAAGKAQPEQAAAPPPVDVQAGPAEEKHPKLEQFVDENGRLHLKTTQEPAAR